MDPDKVDALAFRARPHSRSRRRPAPRRSSVAWIVVAVVAAILFVLVIRALLQRTAWTAGASQVSAHATGFRGEDPGEPLPLDRLPAPMPMVYRCEDRAGSVSLQSQPCAPGQRTTLAVAAPPDIEPARRPLSRLQPRVSSGSQAGFRTTDPERATRATRCAIARRARTETLERVGLGRTYDLLQRLAAMAAEACKGS